MKQNKKSHFKKAIDAAEYIVLYFRQPIQSKLLIRFTC